MSNIEQDIQGFVDGLSTDKNGEQVMSLAGVASLFAKEVSYLEEHLAELEEFSQKKYNIDAGYNDGYFFCDRIHIIAEFLENKNIE